MRKGTVALLVQLLVIVLFIGAVVWGVKRHQHLSAIKKTPSYRYGNTVYLQYVDKVLDHREPGPLCDAALKAHPGTFAGYDAGKARRGCLDEFGYVQQDRHQ